LDQSNRVGAKSPAHTVRQNETETEMFDYAQESVRQQNKEQFVRKK